MDNDLLQELLEEQHDRGGQYRMLNQNQPRMELVDLKLRENLTCCHCGTNLSVKYRRYVNGEAKYFCNKCILIAK